MKGRKSVLPRLCRSPDFLTFKEEQRLDWQKAYLARLCQADQEIAQTAELIQSFTTMLRERQGEQLDSWPKLVKEQGVAELQSFAQEPVEGHVHRLKLIKRQAYGRASFDHLRKRVQRCG